MLFFRHIHPRRQVALAMQRLYKQGLTTPIGGNISIRKGNRIFITPSQTDKTTIGFYNIAIIDLQGKNFTPRLKPSMETAMHLALYKMRSDISAVVHAHPPLSTAFSAQPNLLSANINSESVLILGELGFAPYQPMGSENLAYQVAMAAQNTNVILLQHHGVVTVGSSLFEALDRMEVLEALAKITVIRKLFDITETIPEHEIEQIKRYWQRNHKPR